MKAVVLSLWVGACSALGQCNLTNLNLPALNDLGAANYSSFAGGLYPGGSNTRPPAHETVGLELAAMLRTNTGTNVLLSIGMSNTTQEFATKGPGAFKPRADADPAKHPRLVIVDGAQGGQDATQWTNLNAATWTTVAQRLAAAGVNSNQVRVIWLKQALAHVANYGAFPAHAQALKNMLGQIVQNARLRFPNLAIVYVSSRTRSYTTDPNSLNPEPFAYEAAWATKWLIEEQMAASNSAAPWLSWGPYLWTDGLRGRSDGFTWYCTDLESDLTHPNTNGVTKVADQLLAFFKTDPTAAPWFLRPTLSPPSLTASASPDAGLAPLTVNFSASGSATQYWWTFDDGSFSRGQNPTKTFLVPGRYRVHLAAEDGAGNSALTTLVINVSGPFAVSAISVEGSGVRIAWEATGGLNYLVQAANGWTNYFDLSPLISVPGAGQTTTNFLDAGGATNFPARFYRVKIAP